MNSEDFSNDKLREENDKSNSVSHEDYHQMNVDSDNETIQSEQEMIGRDHPSENQTSPLFSSNINMNKEGIVEADNVRYAGFWMRLWAYLLDIMVISSIVRLVIKPVLRLMDVSVYETSLFTPITILSGTIFFLYFILMTKYFGQTLGKMVFGLRVIDLKGSKPSWGTIIFREFIGRFISGSMFLLKFGYILIGFLPKKQGLHDLFADTTVIHDK